MDKYDIKVIACISAVVIGLCVFALVMELLRTKPGCCWISPPLEMTEDVEKNVVEKINREEVPPDPIDISLQQTQIPSSSKVITPILKSSGSRVTPNQFTKLKRVKSASAARFYAYNRTATDQHQSFPKKRIIRPKTAGHLHRFDKMNGFYGVTFSNSYELNKRKVAFSPAEKVVPNLDSQDEDNTLDLSNRLELDDELEDNIPEDNTSTVSLESKDPTTDYRSTQTSPEEKKPIRLSVSVETNTEVERRITEVAGTQCEASMLKIQVTYVDGQTQTDDDSDFREETAVLREVRTSQGTQVCKSPTPPPPPIELVDTACGPSTIDLIPPVYIPEKNFPTPMTPQREITPPPKPMSRATSRGKSRKSSERRKLNSRGFNFHTAKRATSGRKSANKPADFQPPKKSHPIIKSAKNKTPPFKRQIQGKPPQEKWQIAAERVYMQQRQKRTRPAKSDKIVLGLKTAVSEIKSFTQPPPAVYQVTRAVLLIIGEKEEKMSDWKTMCNMLGRHGPMSPVTRLVNLKKTPLSPYQLNEGNKILKNISKTEISKVSTGASVLYKWISDLLQDNDDSHMTPLPV